MDPLHDVIYNAIKHIAAFMRIECTVDIQERQEEGRSVMAVSLITQDQASFLIGEQGQNLKALEHIMRLIVAQHTPSQIVMLDINNYKKERAEKAIEAARAALGRVRATGKPEALPPMSAYERRVVHTELLTHPDIATGSIGEEPQRRVVIKPA